MPDKFNARATIIILGAVIMTVTLGLLRAIELNADMERVVALAGLLTTIGAWLAPSPLQASSRRGSDFDLPVEIPPGSEVETRSTSTVTTPK